MWNLKVFFQTVVLAGVLSGLIGCEQNIKTGPDPVSETQESHPVAEAATVNEAVAVPEMTPGEPNSQEETIITAVELDSPTSGPVADNNLCFACHVNFKKETLTSVHAMANVGCSRCHGASDAHRSDEDTITPPDVMFPKAKVRVFCMSCHTEESINIPDHKTAMAEADPIKACCTDCHGEHRLNYRTRVWDKITRSLIKDSRVLRLSDDFVER